MSAKTKIEWADATANFWIGCTKVSPACDNCYAERDWDHRYSRVQWGPHGDRSPVKAGVQVVRKVQRGAADFIAKHGRKPRIFVNSLSDFADNHRSIDPAWRTKVWQLARECPDVILMILTKRPQNLAGYLPEDWGQGYPNVWLGTTVENQTEVDRDIPKLLATPAAVRFLSCEPLLGPVDLTRCAGPNGIQVIDCLRGASRDPDWSDCSARIDWVIAGGESGPGARPMHPDWARSLRDQCAAAGVLFHFKQWGEWAPAPEIVDAGGATFHQFDDGTWMQRVGKKAAGRLLDGVTHDGFPS
jgi:protein gp37